MLKRCMAKQPFFNLIFLGRATGEEVLQTSKNLNAVSVIPRGSLSLPAGAEETGAQHSLLSNGKYQNLFLKLQIFHSKISELA